MSIRRQYLKRILPTALMLLMVGALAWGQPAPPQQQEPLGNPTGLTATPGPGVGEVSLTWTPAVNATVRWVWSMRLDGADNQWHQVDAGFAVISGLDAGLNYSFVGNCSGLRGSEQLSAGGEGVQALGPPGAED